MIRKGNRIVIRNVTYVDGLDVFMSRENKFIYKRTVPRRGDEVLLRNEVREIRRSSHIFIEVIVRGG